MGLAFFYIQGIFHSYMQNTQTQQDLTFKQKSPVFCSILLLVNFGTQSICGDVNIPNVINSDSVHIYFWYGSV